jgi:hypothetical protein
MGHRVGNYNGQIHDQNGEENHVIRRIEAGVVPEILRFGFTHA